MDPYRLGLAATRTHYFQLVARLGSIRQASKTLNIAPSSISRVIRQLEDELGILAQANSAKRGASPARANAALVA